MDEDLYYRISRMGEGQLREKMSRFIAFAIPVYSSESARAVIKHKQNEYHDSRHVCWAYMIGPGGEEWQLNDNGEPSGTAGKPILGQIRSAGVTDVVVIVVRYFGGIKLGTSGLITAYREAARLALEDAGKKECYRMREVDIRVGYERLDAVLRIVRGVGCEILNQNFDNVCTLRIGVKSSGTSVLKGKLEKIEGCQCNLVETA